MCAFVLRGSCSLFTRMEATGDERERLQGLVLQCVTVCEAKGYLQLTIPLLQLRENLEELWDELPATVVIESGVLGAESGECVVEEKGEEEKEGEAGNQDEKEERGSVEKEEGEGADEGSARGREEGEKEDKGEAEEEEEREVVDEEKGEAEEEREDGGEVVVNDDVEEEEENSDMDWTMHTPDISCLPDTILTPDVPPENEQQLHHQAVYPDDRPDCDDIEEKCDSVEGDSSTSAPLYTAPGWSGNRSCQLSPTILVQPNFDLSASSIDVSLSSSSVHSHPHFHPQTPSTAYYTPSSRPPRVSSYFTAPLPPPSSPSHSSTPSLQTPAHSTHYSPTPPPHPTHCSPTPPPHPTHCSPTPLNHTPSHSLPSSHISLSPSPQSHIQQTSAITVDSSDDEQADTNLENLFSHMRLKSENREVELEEVHRKSSCNLTDFIANNSEEEESAEEIDGSSEEDGRCVFGDIESASDFRTPSCSSRSEASSFTPYTPALPSLDFLNSPAPRGPPKTVPAKGVGRRHPLTEQNLSPFTPGVRTEVKKTRAPVTTPSAHKNFSRSKKAMARELFNLFNHSVFGDQLGPDMELIWNSKLRTTAGYCRNRGLMSDRKSQIELSTKVIDSYERLKNTLIHEMCHAAVWIIDGIKDGGHKRHWRAWASRANSVHPDLDPITRCHSYDISYKFHYQCTRCDYKQGRHSKSINLTHARCPYCLSVLKLEGPAGPPKINRYAQFVKDHYSEVNLRTPGGGHKAVMEKIREQYYNSCPRQTMSERV